MMKGGGAMRAAAKVASFGVNGGLRGAPSVSVAEPTMANAAGITSRPAATNSGVSSVATDEGRSSVLLSSQNGKIDASVQRPLWEIDDWEFAGDGHFDSNPPMPRVVFGEVPTLEEAKEATYDLKDALNEVYFASNSNDGSETKACITTESVVANPSVPKPALQAFMLLKESPAAQSVVASLASDKNVWDAVMQNEKVMEFFKSEHTNMNAKELSADGGFYDQGSMKLVDDGDCSESSVSGFVGFMENIRLTATEMVKNVSDFIQSLFGGFGAGNVSEDEKGSTSSGMHVDKLMGASFMGLAVLAIMVVVLKRG